MTTQSDTALELGDIQAAALMPRPHPYAGAYWAVRIDDRHAGRELLRRLIPLLDPVAAFDPDRPVSLGVGLSFAGLEALGVPGGVAGQLPVRVPAGHGRSRGLPRGRRGERAGALGGTAGFEGRAPGGGRAGAGTPPSCRPWSCWPRTPSATCPASHRSGSWTCTCPRTGASSSASRTASASRPSRAPASWAATRTRHR